jgi:zinc transport system permease protein
MIGEWLGPWQDAVAAMPFEWTKFEFMRLALLAVLLIAPLLGALGTVVVANRLAFFSEAVGHSAFTGIALGVVLGLGNPLWSMVGFALLVTLFVTWLRRRGGLASDTAIGLVMAFTVSLGIVILSRGGDFARFTGFLIGDMLAIAPDDLLLLAVLAAVVMIVFLVFFNRLLLASVNPALARSRMHRPSAAELLFAGSLAVTVTLSLPWIGILVINALLILPAAAARNLARNTTEFFAWSIVVSIAAGVAGLIISFYASTATGATIVLAAMGIYLASLVCVRTRSA